MAKDYLNRKERIKEFWNIKKEEQRQNHGYRQRFDGCQMGRRYGGMGGKR